MTDKPKEYHDAILRITALETMSRISIDGKWDPQAMVWVAVGFGRISGLVTEAPTVPELFKKISDIVADLEELKTDK